MRKGIGQGSLVPVVLKRSALLPISLLAILKTGCGFVAIDPYWPVSRIREVLQELQATLVLAGDPSTADALREFSPFLIHPEELAADEENTGIRVGPEDPFYCIFTSGSTGKPKGAINKQAGIANRFFYMNKRYRPHSGDTILLTSNHSFDAAVWQLLWPLTNGNRLVIPENSSYLDLERIIALIEEYRVTITDFVPSVFHLLVQWLEERPDYRLKLTSLRQLLIGGEAMNATHVQQFRSYLENVSITNTYGPAEASIGTIFYEVQGNEELTVPIGRAIDHVGTLLLDASGRMVPRGVMGELHLGGICTGAGYL